LQCTFINVTYITIIPIDIKTLGQYTGLKDKNGVEIYEGDIVEIDNFPYEIDFHGGAFHVRDIRARDENFGEDGEDYYYFHDDLLVEHRFICKVIGNIYENPELLETK
jgi:uncharacterized phage protein (TIGR01671 family)